MADAIKPGAMGDPASPVTPPEYAGSMAEDMEAALNSILFAEGRITFDMSDNSREARDRRMLFVAIAQGIVSHLRTHEGALAIKFGGVVSNGSIDINTE